MAKRPRYVVNKIRHDLYYVRHREHRTIICKCDDGYYARKIADKLNGREPVF